MFSLYSSHTRRFAVERADDADDGGTWSWRSQAEVCKVLLEDVELAKRNGWVARESTTITTLSSSLSQLVSTRGRECRFFYSLAETPWLLRQLSTALSEPFFPLFLVTNIIHFAPLPPPVFFLGASGELECVLWVSFGAILWGLWRDPVGELWGDPVGELWGDPVGELWGDPVGELWGDPVSFGAILWVSFGAILWVSLWVSSEHVPGKVFHKAYLKVWGKKVNVRLTGNPTLLTKALEDLNLWVTLTFPKTCVDAAS
ncbi:hypothetical protein PAPYR_11722 [Paratrimastix pyriformis]|uniref:Uncharacterized protein n=1 Tax=Paratrimastix pyriformis TaxID=342808 RepID=A0ABQ8U355_9EUKA|nr:hypothetical protein PAPYR_11722 [Paratrimastix pyriformis]